MFALIFAKLSGAWTAAKLLFNGGLFLFKRNERRKGWRDAKEDTRKKVDHAKKKMDRVDRPDTDDLADSLRDKRF